MEKSQEIYDERQRLESTRDGIEKRWALANNNLGLHQLVHEFLIKQVIGPQEEVQRLQKELSEKLKARDAEKETYLLKWEELRKSLDLFTRPAIEKGIERLHAEASMCPKLKESIISKSSGGFKMIPTVIIETNTDAIRKFQRIVREATETLRSMQNKPISKIESFTQEKLEDLRQIDFSVCRKEMDELSHERQAWITSPVR